MTEARRTDRRARGARGGLARRKPGSPSRPTGAPAKAHPDRPSAHARRVALDVLDRVLGPDHRPFDETFQGHPQLAKLAVRDRAFARLLVTTVLRRLGQIDHTALPLLRYRPKDCTVTNMLRLGAAQLLFLSTPPHAAVAETVRLAAAASAARCRCSTRSCASWRPRGASCSRARTPRA